MGHSRVERLSTADRSCQPKSALHALSPDIHGEAHGRIDAMTILYGISMQSCRDQATPSLQHSGTSEILYAQEYSNTPERSSIPDLLQFRITSLLQSISILLLSDSVALIGQSLVLHNCVIINRPICRLNNLHTNSTYVCLSAVSKREFRRGETIGNVG
jgi:hypothetical protein